MALKATIFKAELQLADIDHGHYTDLSLTLARHPSETDERMMVRLVALLLNAHQVQADDAGIDFGAGLSTPDQPDVRLQDLSGRMRLWIEVGQPDGKALARACGKADEVHAYAYGPAAELWWRGIEARVQRLDRLQVWRIPSAQAQALVQFARRSMRLQATVQEGQLTLSDEAMAVTVEPLRWA